MVRVQQIRSRATLKSDREDFVSVNVAKRLRKSMEDNPRWQELCKLASVEQDPNKLLDLITEINRLLAEKETRLKNARKPADKTS
jgi:hypothetical protein